MIASLPNTRTAAYSPAFAPRSAALSPALAPAAEQTRLPAAQPTTHTLQAEMDAFLLDREARNQTPATLAWYRRCLRHWQTFLDSQAIHATAQVTPTVVRAFLVHLARRGHTPGGIATLFTGVKAFLNWQVAESDFTGPHPLHKIENPKRPQDPLEPVPLAHVQAMLDACPPDTFRGDRDRALILFLLDTGVRHQELTNLCISHVDLETGRVLVRQGKGRKSRTVFCGQRTCQALTTYFVHRPALAPQQPLWSKEDGGKLSKSGIRQILRRRAADAHVPEPGVHAFRRAFAINLLRNGIDVFSLQRLLGHSELSTVLRYLAQVTDDLHRAHNRFGVVDNLHPNQSHGEAGNVGPTPV
jgi:integrase/recombinase XerD